MRRRTFGATGWSVSELALGTMMFGAMGNTDQADSARIINRALDAGINFVDTADVYSEGECEKIVGAAIAQRRDELVLATKFGLPTGVDPNRSGASRRWIIQAVEGSLRRLSTDRIDLYQLHRFDPRTDLSETLSALDDLIRAGKVLAVGTSTFAAEHIVEAQWVAERTRTHRFLSEQPQYSILGRAPERAVFPVAQQYGMGVLTYSPLHSGWLSGRPRTESHRARGWAELHDPTSEAGRRRVRAVEELQRIAADAGLTMPQLAIAFVTTHPAVTSAIIGPRTQEQLDGLLAAADIVLGDDVLDRIDAVVAPGTELHDDSYHATPSALIDPALRRR
ncbi:MULTISPECIES: aldo/keto reductase [unclassified Microbacterium]|uniref:aldo/keto reductase n=1 Tax=unclassified Microbacterium TaxID=2609290 RepID=UPI00214C917A|nr:MULTISPECIES: aldo/keto reductase [unclassified Microbacterium]MCR2809078.1 aldo/keto reductase [Microbacterium sp. zg.B185]WIM20233.1 aldo/keto reductase [Microbacterium sp. zg-B185]